MASFDLRRVLAGWEYEPNQITVRKIKGDDGTVKIQMRLDLGILQMEPNGRPDGQTPHGCESLLDYHEARLRHYEAKNGTHLGFELSPEECQALREEALQYYHRYLAEFVLEDFAGVERDTARNVRLLDFCRAYAREESDQLNLEQYRPYLIMMNTRAKAHLALRRGAFKTALARVDAGLAMLADVAAAGGQEQLVDEMIEVSILRSLRDEIVARLPVDPLQKLEAELQKALSEERYEDAAALRDRMTALRSGRPAASERRRNKK